MTLFFKKAVTPEERPTKKLFGIPYPWIFLLDYFIGTTKDFQYLIDIGVVKSILKEGEINRVPIKMPFL